MNSYKDLFYSYKHLGLEKIKNGTILIGRAPHIADEAWLNEVYPVLEGNDIRLLESKLKTDIPDDYKKFLTEVSNGLSILVGTLSLDGLRSNYNRTVEDSRQPFSLLTKNLEEKPSNAKDSYFFIGGYK